MFAHAHDTELSPCVYKTWRNLSLTSPIIRLSLDDTAVSQQMAFISGPSLPQLSDHIFEILQDLVVAEIQWYITHRQTDTQAYAGVNKQKPECEKAVPSNITCNDLI